ncbi:two-component system CheB/CheR fusion protein [Bradyrhizobium macuxiense]|uniref:Blue-light-activated histidine kinase n=1 Tax=Bradyrhizobium macuxiense TaxID=1755647 RepID=A0A560LNT6_9BRAD|nr:chemotaxis protein CheB [Bradyrhizobium macuxiense]TWB96114.1 two-component system CheB/CheR fusion protein [Bradyrhizobium macuxiense]
MADTSDEERDETTEPNLARTVVVGIGASAGGVQALQQLFAALPEKTGAAFVVVVHLDPDLRSEMSNILAARTHMPVLQVGEPIPLNADHVYVIPPDRRLHITNDEIATAEFDEPRGKRAPIDLFFRSLAEQHGDGCAVILTGAGSDGSVGVRAVKESGGIILVQDPNEAEFPSMPRSAIATGIADFVLPIREIAQRLTELVREKNHEGPGGGLRGLDADLLRRILAHVRVRTGHDFSKYKRATILRRIARRMQVTRADSPKDYYDVLRDNTDEAQALLGDLLISVTSFFRDKEAFRALELQVIPQLFNGKLSDRSIRVWVPGCATGEEAYSIAMLLLEQASRQDIRPTIQVFGSDIDARALAIAREGMYPVAIETDVSEDRLRRFFVKDGDQYRVRQELRDLVLFASHSLLKDPPFSRLDLIACRNLLIYLDRELQELACNTFHYALNPDGFLMLGTSESADHPPGQFRTFDRKARIYQSSASPGELRLLPRLLGSVGLIHEQAANPIRPPSTTSLLNEAAAHRQALEKLAPPSILVDQLHRVLHMSDNAGRFLQPSGGPLSGNIIDLVRPELRFELRSALNRVFETSQPWLSLPIPVRFNGAPHRVLMHVKPLDDHDDHGAGSAVVLFIEGDRVDNAIEGAISANDASKEIVARLREELQQTQTRLRTTREESDAANEELRAANEELQSINEEYRSTSEELETSKEELQSINEELQTVNSELKLKLEAVSRAHSDLQNLMAATDFGILFLDSSLRIKRFTQQVTDLFSITPSDEGRPIADFAHRLEYQNLVSDAHAVLANLSPIKHEIRSRNGRWYDVRLRPYRTVDDKIDGIVLTFVDMTDRRHTEDALRISERQLRQQTQLVELSRDPIFIWDYDGGILAWNRGSEQLYGYSRDEAVGKRKNQLLGTMVPGGSFAELRSKLLDEGNWTGELQHKTKNGRELTVESRIVLETIDGRRLALESTRDVSERKAWEEQQKLLLRELTHRVKNTLTVVQSIAHQTRRFSKSYDEFTERLDGRLAALARAHSLLVDSDWKGADLATLARRQLEPYTSGNNERIKVKGGSVFLPPDLATPFGLVFHELATNAAKYGSFSQQTGTVDLSWTLRSQGDQPLLTVIWRESGGPAVKQPETAGFGSELIEKAIPHAVVRREFGPDGTVCTIELPIPKASLDDRERLG